MTTPLTPFFAPFEVLAGDLLVGGIKARALAERFGTPLYIYDAGLVESRYAGLRRALPERADIYYAMKANPSLALCALLRKLGAGAEAASRGELMLASRAGFAAEAIVMAGPAKSDADHLEALRMGIRSIHVESEQELLRLDAMARSSGLPSRAGPVPFGVRVNTASAIEEERNIIGGAGPRKFGVDEESLGSFLHHARACTSLALAGVHVFNASNVRSAAALVENAARIFRIAASISERIGRPLDTIDIGGGLGVPYAPGEAPLDIDSFGRGIRALIEEGSKGPLANARLILEPGRYLTAEAGLYLCRVIEVKVSRGNRYLLVDGGIHHLLRPALLEAAHPIVAANRASEEHAIAHDVAGPLCTGLDVLGKNVLLPAVVPGDLIAVLCAGAYGYTESMLEFLSHPAPAEVVVRNGQAEVARPRVEPEERLDRQRIPSFL